MQILQEYLRWVRQIEQIALLECCISSSTAAYALHSAQAALMAALAYTQMFICTIIMPSLALDQRLDG
jgi:hypothetical protein